uniref:Uncharacterized protein n=1 Tax=Brassica oleracea var. oleracea TaxID=109376 RepID=A0A0D3BAU7_BRAOL
MVLQDTGGISLHTQQGVLLGTVTQEQVHQLLSVLSTQSTPSTDTFSQISGSKIHLSVGTASTSKPQPHLLTHMSSDTPPSGTTTNSHFVSAGMKNGLTILAPTWIIDTGASCHVIAPKEEFEVEEEIKDAYYKALCGSPPPSQDIPIPKRPVRSPNAPFAPSMVSSDYLTTLRDFYQIPSGVVFWIPSGNESAKDPPEGFFTCYDAFLHWLGVLILSYELGMDLNPGDFEGFWFKRGTGIDGSYRMAPKKGMAIIHGHTSHPKACEQDLSADSCRSFCQADLLRSRPFFWNSFTVERIRSTVVLHRSRVVSQPLDVPYGVKPVIDVLPAQRQRIRSRKGKGVASENVLGTFRCQNGTLGIRVFNAALDGSFWESRISHFKAEEAERELFRFRKEVEEQSWRQAELHSRALVRAERRGKRAIVAEMKRRAALFASEFKSFKDDQKFVGDFRECRGSVATLYESQNEDFSFPAEVAEMSGLMNGCAHAKSLVPPIEGRFRQLWDSIEVSEDTAEAGTGVGDERARVADREVDTDGEVDQPASSFGVSMSGFFDFNL